MRLRWLLIIYIFLCALGCQLVFYTVAHEDAEEKYILPGFVLVYTLLLVLLLFIAKRFWGNRDKRLLLAPFVLWIGLSVAAYFGNGMLMLMLLASIGIIVVALWIWVKPGTDEKRWLKYALRLGAIAGLCTLLFPFRPYTVHQVDVICYYQACACGDDYPQYKIEHVLKGGEHGHRIWEMEMRLQFADKALERRFEKEQATRVGQDIGYEFKGDIMVQPWRIYPNILRVKSFALRAAVRE